MRAGQNLISKITIFACIMSVWAMTAYAYYQSATELGIDGTNTTVAVWRVIESGHYKIQGVYGNGPSWSVMDISHVSTEDAIDYPILAVSKDLSTNLRAAVIWLSKNLVTLRKNLRVSVYNSATGTWSAPTTVSSDTTNETVRADYLVDISDDGQTISILWTAYLADLGQNVIRSAISTDGGTNWSTTNVANIGSTY